MKKALIVGFALLLLLFIGVFYLGNSLPNENITIAAERDEVKQQLENVLKENVELKEELQQLKINTANSELDTLATFELEKKNFSGSLEDIIAELVKHSEIIPYEGVLGGDLLLREKGAKVLSHEWIFAPFDDGHISGYLLIHYSIVDGKPGNWRVIDSYLFGEEE